MRIIWRYRNRARAYRSPNTAASPNEKPKSDVGGTAAKAAYSTNRVIHMHIPETAGNSFKTAIERSTSRKMRISPQGHEDEYHSFAPEDYDFHSGHIGYDTA